MPSFTPDQVPQRDNPDGPCGGYREFRFSDAGGLTQFGAYVEILPPGAASSIKHWHTTEDEMVYVLEGEITLLEGNRETLLRAGDGATFRAGDPVGHCYENRSDTPTRCMIIGTRAREDTVTYPDDDRILYRDGTGEDATARWTDTAGAPASDPYADRLRNRTP